nr:uncharacterized protein LOC105335871 isoform X3 [Crassostrea gigas]
MANFAGWAIFVSAYVFHSCLGYGPDAGLWDSEPLQCVNKEFMQGYPRIKGPKSVHDRIAIIGAGPSGLHMAYELKKRGFRNIVIFESRDEVGGKTTSRLYRNVWVDLGTVGLTESYDKTVDLLEKFNTGFEVRPTLPGATWLNRKEYRPTTETIPVPIERIQQASQRYTVLHQCFFGTYDSELMPRPSPEILRKIHGSIEEFLLRYNLTDLQPIFYTAITLNGYGFLNETSAIYGLTFVTPSVVQSFLRPERGAYRLFGGWQNLCREIARRSDVDIRFNVNIKRINRKNGVQIVYGKKHSGQTYVDDFDFLILTPAMNSLFKVVDFNQHELSIFSHLRNSFYLKSVINSISPGRRSFSPLDTYLYDFQNVEYSVYRTVNPHQLENNITGVDYQLGLRENVDPDGSQYETSVYVQTGKSNPWKPDVDAHIQTKLFEHLRDFKKSNPQVVEQVKWGYYFPNFPPEAATGGALWDVLDMQGHYNTWYIGSSVCFDAIESVFEYNYLILKLFA